MKDISIYDPNVIKDFPNFDEKKGMWYKNVKLDGGIIKREYEPIIETTCGTMPLSRAKSASERNKALRMQQLAQLNNKIHPTGTCPFRGRGMSLSCNEKCAWWNGAKCSILSAEEAKIEPKRICPISAGACDKNCVFGANNSCKLANSIKRIIAGEELSK